MIKFSQQISEAYIDPFLHALWMMKQNPGQKLRLDWSRVEEIMPAGFALLACLLEGAHENKIVLENKFIKPQLKKHLMVKSVCDFNRTKPKPDLSINQKGIFLALQTRQLIPGFVETVIDVYQKILGEDQQFMVRLILNELMQNSLDHSGSERSYLYAGQFQNEFHCGVLDLGVGIPAKLMQRYLCDSDGDYLSLAFKEGVSTRRIREGGYGLAHTFDLVKNENGRLILVSNKAQIRRYFKNKKVVRKKLKHFLAGTWCFVRFEIKK